MAETGEADWRLVLESTTGPLVEVVREGVQAHVNPGSGLVLGPVQSALPPWNISPGPQIPAVLLRVRTSRGEPGHGSFAEDVNIGIAA